MQENGFWDDVKRAEEVTKECKIIKDKIERYENLVSRIDDIEVLAELAEEDEDTINEVIKEIRSIEKEVENYKIAEKNFLPESEEKTEQAVSCNFLPSFLLLLSLCQSRSFLFLTIFRFIAILSRSFLSCNPFGPSIPNIFLGYGLICISMDFSVLALTEIFQIFVHFFRVYQH